MFYTVAIHQHNGEFIAEVPDLPTLTICGDTMADVLSNARLSIIEHLQHLTDNDAPIPDGKEINVHLDNPKYYGHIWAIVSLDSLRFAPKTLSYHLDIPSRLLVQIYDNLGNQANNELVQAFIIDAVSQKLSEDSLPHSA